MNQLPNEIIYEIIRDNNDWDLLINDRRYFNIVKSQFNNIGVDLVKRPKPYYQDREMYKKTDEILLNGGFVINYDGNLLTNKKIIKNDVPGSSTPNVRDFNLYEPSNIKNSVFINIREVPGYDRDDYPLSDGVDDFDDYVENGSDKGLFFLGLHIEDESEIYIGKGNCKLDLFLTLKIWEPINIEELYDSETIIPNTTSFTININVNEYSSISNRPENVELHWIDNMLENRLKNNDDWEQVDYEQKEDKERDIKYLLKILNSL